MSKKDKIKYELHICEYCASERQLKMEIFQLKRGRVRSKHPCLICKAETNTIFSGVADSDNEIELVKEKLA